ncbi:hypothetical protein HPP92_007809 [Vanilla planifolia]|uniref:Histone-lysine N-methyltransferase SUVR5 n=1 Tax=Vanilla planifolia TaxID=51239 RepID=A0A835REK0_VANPL|nr:hypothetical protein HPP92_007809 [Vanilla planifolia]
MFDQGNETKREEKFTGFPYSTSTFAYETGSKEMVKHAPGQSNTSSRYRQCLAFIEAKGRQCGRWASDGDIYCCVHLTYNPSRKIPQVDHALPVEGLMCQGTTTRGKNCKHRARYGSTFCKKHRFQGNNGLVIADTVSASSIERLKEKQQEEGAPEKISSSYASGIQELILVREDTVSAEENLVPIKIEETLDERNCLMKQSELCNALPKGICTDPQHCIGNYGSNDSPQCLEFPRRHSLYCENHLPKFLKRARNGKTRLISKDIFINLLNNCSSRKQKINLHQACELLYGFLKSGLSCQKFVSRSDSVARLLAEASKDLNVGEYLLKLVSSEKEKIMSLWGFDDDTDKQVSTESNSLSTMNQNSGLMVKCKSCAQEFSDDHMLGRHWAEVHKKDARQLFKGYVCAVCMSLFTSRKVLETHVIEKHGVQFLEHSALLRCVSCNSHFVNPEKLWQHVFSLHLSEMRMPNFSGHNCNMLDDNPVQMEVETRMEHSQENGVPEEVALQKYICQFCGLNFDLLPDLGRHHQIAHMNPTSTSSFSSKRADYFLKNDGANHFGLWKNCGSNFRFKNRSKLGMVKNFNSSGLMTQLKSKLYKQPSEASSFGGLSESSCCHVAEILFPKIQKTKVRPSNLEILSVARSACCRVNLNSTLVVKYGILPENIYLKAAKLCSELNILVGWHQEGFVCPRGCKPVPNPYVLAPLEPLPPLSFEPSEVESRNDAEWEMDECHYLLDATNFNWKSVGQTIILCEDVSFGKEAIPVACVVDEDLKHLLEIDVNAVSSSEQSGVVVPWQGFVYVTERLIDSSLRLDTKSSQLGCSCRQPNCYPDKCDHVYLFNNDYENAVDIHGESMNGRFPYDDQGRILLEEGYLVYECNSMCCCDMSCKNRVLQKGVQVKLEVFRTEKKGWAVRTRNPYRRARLYANTSEKF